MIDGMKIFLKKGLVRGMVIAVVLAFSVVVIQFFLSVSALMPFLVGMVVGMLLNDVSEVVRGVR